MVERLENENIFLIGACIINKSFENASVSMF